MGRFPWWRILVLLVAAVALVWWVKQRTKTNPYGSEVRVARVTVAPVDGRAGTYRIAFGSDGWETRWVGDGSGDDAREGLETALDGLRAATEAFRKEKAGFERAVIEVAPAHRGVVPYGLTAQVVQTLVDAGFVDVAYASPGSGG